MAENSTLAFGRYLKTLRERRGLSLLEVSSLSQAFAETLNKGYLSRCENGHQRLALSKVVPLGRIYGVSADVLLERIELDMELDMELEMERQMDYHNQMEMYKNMEQIEKESK